MKKHANNNYTTVSYTTRYSRTTAIVLYRVYCSRESNSAIQAHTSE